MISLLLLNNFYPVISHRRVQKKATNYCVRFGRSLWSARTSCQRKGLTSRAGMTCHARREFFVPKIAIFSQFSSIFKYNPGKANNKLLYNFYPVISYRTSSKEKESDELLYRGSVTRYGPLEPVASAGGLSSPRSSSCTRSPIFRKCNTELRKTYSA